MGARGWRSQRWDQMGNVERVLIMLLVSLKIATTVSAWADLAERPAELVNGSKRRWAMIIAIDVIGPLLYWRRGRIPE
ncbi:MAG: hypothetical protein EA389_13495 [Ilumatobacter sp.]|nr:MAG: hypothetical protein EA389_13495 [Ilumatobacter sp.]